MSGEPTITAGELKPCPFCGGDKISEDRASGCMFCETCSAMGAGAIGVERADAVAAWNTRPTEQATAQAERERILDALHERLPYPTEACTIVRTLSQGNPS